MSSIDDLLRWNGLSVWERGFLESLRYRRRSLTEKQRATLASIVSRFDAVKKYWRSQAEMAGQ